MKTSTEERERGERDDQLFRTNETILRDWRGVRELSDEREEKVNVLNPFQILMLHRRLHSS